MLAFVRVVCWSAKYRAMTAEVLRIPRAITQEIRLGTRDFLKYQAYHPIKRAPTKNRAKDTWKDESSLQALWAYLANTVEKAKHTEEKRFKRIGLV
jgi:hypothetical protein